MVLLDRSKVSLPSAPFIGEKIPRLKQIENVAITRLPFGVTNGVPAFQKATNTIVDGLEGIAVDVEDVVLGGATEAEHDKKLAEYCSRAQIYNLTINEEKSKFKVREFNFLGHRSSDGKIHPDESRMKPLLEFPLPKTLKELDHFVGRSVYHFKWVGDFANTAALLLKTKQDEKLPLDLDAIRSIETTKRAISRAALWIPDRTKPFELETNTSGQRSKTKHLPLCGLYRNIGNTC